MFRFNKQYLNYSSPCPEEGYNRQTPDQLFAHFHHLLLPLSISLLLHPPSSLLQTFNPFEFLTEKAAEGREEAMHRCSGRSSSHGHGRCSCGLFQGVSSNGSSPGSFSILFAMPNRNIDQERDDDCSVLSSFSSPAVDCTLSLGTPSTRQARCQKPPSSPSCMSSFGWETFVCPTKPTTPARGAGGGGGLPSGNLNMGGDSLLARRCANCDTTSTPLWRNGPRGPKSLCNACGIRYKKEERRAAATALPSSSSSTPPAASRATVEAQQHLMGYSYQNYQQQQQPWSYSPMSTRLNSAHQGSPFSISPSISSTDFMLVEDHNREYRRSNEEEEDGDSEVDAAALPYFSWRLNVHPPPTDRPGLLHDLT